MNERKRDNKIMRWAHERQCAKSRAKRKTHNKNATILIQRVFCPAREFLLTLVRSAVKCTSENAQATQMTMSDKRSPM